ncbi:NfeD family protein [Capnocytophaga leadbetteri]|uniref:NfeD family protein n=1 Tax=Capnocytophaga leadbetteri TaxID=327575 RepID=UPI0028EEE31B|nr:NfeD family protein [Capnocytophaga leadbetteri]
MEAFNNLDLLLRGFWLVAIPVTIIFLIQMVLTFIGSDASDGTSADFDGDFDGGDAPFQLFSFRNLMNFLLGFSWTGISFYKIIPHQTVLILLAVAVGGLFVYFFFLIIRALMRLSEDNTFKLSETIGKTAEVYVPIPENKSGRGKITISVRGTMHELEAMTAGARIPSNVMVKILSIEDSVLFVERI